MERKQNFLKSFGWLAFGRTAGDAFLFAMFVVLSTTFGPEGIGRYSFAMGLTGLFAAVADFGLHPFSLVEFSREQRFGLLCGRILLLRIPLVLITWAVLAMAAWLGALPADAEAVVLIVGAYQLAMTWVDGVNAAFVARGDSGLAARTELVLKAVAAGAAIVLATSGASLETTVLVLPVVALAAAVVALAIASRRYGAPDFREAVAGARTLVGRALPFAESQVLAQLSARVDVVLLGFLLGVGAAGVYNVGFRVVFLLLFIPHFAAVSFTPHATRLHREDPAGFAPFLNASLGAVLLLAAPATAGLWLVGPELLATIFGPEFAESGDVLRILALVLGLSFVSRTLGNFLLAAELEHARNRAYRATAVASVVGNAVLIPWLGVQGAAVAAVLTECVLSALLLGALRPRVGLPRVGARLGISLVGTLAFFVPFSLWTDVSLPAVVLGSLCIYGAVLSVFPVTRNGELRSVFRMLGHGAGGE